MTCDPPSRRGRRCGVLLLIPAVLLAGCEQYETPDILRETAKMGAAERASYIAISRYLDCMRPFVRAAKKGPPLSDAQVDRFGDHCPAELHDAVAKHDAWTLVRSPDLYDDRETMKLPHAERLRLQEKELAGTFWCDFRTCYLA